MLNLVVALATESRALIEYFRMSEDRSVPGFRVFRSREMRMIVTGMGRVSCAAGVAALAGLSAREHPDRAPAWLNVGIAGHGSHGVGEGVHAVRILEAATDRCWYPAQVLAMPGRAGSLCTVDRPETSYGEDYVYDMEASAFYATALRYATSELVQVYKVISDNRDNGVETVRRHRIRDAIAVHAPVIGEIAAALSRLAQEVDAVQPGPGEFDPIVARWHFSTSQRHQLRRLLRQWAVLMGDQPVLDEALNRCPSARSVLGEIGDRLDAVYRRTDTAGP